MRLSILLLAAASLSACMGAPNPHKTVAALDVTAPTYETGECSAARQAALAYRREVGARILKGVGWAFVPVYGSYRAYKIDAAKDEERARLNEAVEQTCGPA
ncbi:hypothetical protein [Paraburkholderia fungorum]|uniref:hypothetical protein n=1 Tax=Paraburkholderia fungorum TaxID=134537 RepID=UPI003D6C2ABD